MTATTACSRSSATGFGVDTPFVLADKFWVMPAIMVVITWKYFGFHMMIYIAGLQSIPNEVIEAARLDGVKKWQIVRHIKLPMIRSAIVISVFFAITGALQLFDIIMPLTNGGPSHSSHTIVTFLYQFGILRMKLGFGGAVSVILFIACVAWRSPIAASSSRWSRPDGRHRNRNSAPQRHAAAAQAPPPGRLGRSSGSRCSSIALFVLVPLYTTVLGGFKEIGELRVNPFGLPASWDPIRFTEILTGSNYFPSMGNSLRHRLSARSCCRSCSPR